MKTSPVESVVKPWVSELPFTQQALLMLSLRGPDGVQKHSAAKYMLYYIRDVVLHAAYPDYDESFHPGGFMRCDYENFNQAAKDFYCDLDAYPMHFLMHFIHAAEVIGYSHPSQVIRDYWFNFYCHGCHCLHMTPETKEELFHRLKL